MLAVKYDVVCSTDLVQRAHMASHSWLAVGEVGGDGR